MRIGDTVRRPLRPFSLTVQAYLAHLRDAGFTGAPLPFGVDEQGREVLSFVPGDVQLRDQAREAVAESGDSAARFTLELAEGILSYICGRFETALARVDASLRTGVGAGEDSREWFARRARCGVLAVMDRYDEAFMMATESIRAAQQARQGWALHMFETWRGRQLVQLGQLADAAAALEGRFAPDDAHLVISALDAASVVALGRVAIHTGNQSQAAVTAAIATIMLHSGEVRPQLPRGASGQSVTRCGMKRCQVRPELVVA